MQDLFLQFCLYVYSWMCALQVGLCSYLQHMHWFCENDVSHILFPRCYNVCHPDELTAFTHDFRLTACLGLLKWLVSKYEKQGGTSLKSTEGKVKCKSNVTLNLWTYLMLIKHIVLGQRNHDLSKFTVLRYHLTFWQHIVSLVCLKIMN